MISNFCANIGTCCSERRFWSSTRFVPCCGRVNDPCAACVRAGSLSVLHTDAAGSTRCGKLKRLSLAWSAEHRFPERKQITRYQMKETEEKQIVSDQSPDKRYVLIEAGRLEELIRQNYLLSKSVLAFEYLLGKSDRPMYLAVDGVLEVLGITDAELDECRIKRLIRVKVVQRQMLYNLFDLVILSERIRRRKLQ